MIGEYDDRIPDLVEPISAWRCFRLGGDSQTPLLLSPFRYTVWPPLKGTRASPRNFITAECRAAIPQLHDCPSSPVYKKFHDGTGCGIYSYKLMEDMAWDWPLRGIYPEKPGIMGAFYFVWAKVLIWGEVYEHERGYRSEFARIESLAYLKGAGTLGPDILEWIADFYGVEVEHFGERKVTDINIALRHRKEEESVKVNIKPLYEIVKILAKSCYRSFVEWRS